MVGSDSDMSCASNKDQFNGSKKSGPQNFPGFTSTTPNVAWRASLSSRNIEQEHDGTCLFNCWILATESRRSRPAHLSTNSLSLYGVASAKSPRCPCGPLVPPCGHPLPPFCSKLVHLLADWLAASSSVVTNINTTSKSRLKSSQPLFRC